MTGSTSKAARSVGTVAGLVALLAAGSDAATIFTPALEGGAPTGNFLCLVINVTARPVDVTNELRDAETGEALITVPCTLPPGGGATTCAISAMPSSGRAYCVATVKGGRRSVRVTLTSNATGASVSAP
jgi:hypothetical protein